MTWVYLGCDEGLVRAKLNGCAGEGEWVVSDRAVSSVIADPLQPRQLYAATLGHGLLRSDDGGASWDGDSSGIASPLVSMLDVSRSDRNDGLGVVYAGTEPSALYRSEDAGGTFEELRSLQEVPSRGEWSFPPAPDTDHVRSIALDQQDPNVVLVGIELGGVMHSTDRGQTWAERRDADPDPHTLLTHPAAPGRVYEGGGAFYAESLDGGVTWQRHLEGIPDEVRYFFSMEVDPGDPDTVVLSAARDPFTGHGVFPGAAVWSTLFRRAGDAPWIEVTEGLPPSEGTAMGTLATSPTEAGVFFYVTMTGALYRSHDGGHAWEEVVLGWAADSHATVRSVAAVES